MERNVQGCDRAVTNYETYLFFFLNGAAHFITQASLFYDASLDKMLRRAWENEHTTWEMI